MYPDDLLYILILVIPTKFLKSNPAFGGWAGGLYPNDPSGTPRLDDIRPENPTVEDNLLYLVARHCGFLLGFVSCFWILDSAGTSLGGLFRGLLRFGKIGFDYGVSRSKLLGVPTQCWQLASITQSNLEFRLRTGQYPSPLRYVEHKPFEVHLIRRFWTGA